MDRSSLVLLPECEVRALLRGSDVSLRMLRPPFPALGIGALRVLRLRARDSAIELVVGYERYERLFDTATADATNPTYVGRRPRRRRTEGSREPLNVSCGGS